MKDDLVRRDRRLVLRGENPQVIASLKDKIEELNTKSFTGWCTHRNVIDRTKLVDQYRPYCF